MNPQYPPPTKAEILLTRGCNLRCSYCDMVKYTTKDSFSLDWQWHSELSDEEWERVPAKLIEMGVPFAPIYGAEPLTRVPALRNFVRESTKLNLPVTVITTGMLLTDAILISLIECGLDSITLSHDIVPANESVSAKTKEAEEILENLTMVMNDVAVVVTIHKKNYRLLPKFIRRMNKMGVWVCMDLYHPDRDQPGSKCKGVDESLLLDYSDTLDFCQVMSNLWRMKGEGFNIHPPLEYFKMFETIRSVERHALNYGWKCRSGPWITIDSDGSVFGCDDYQPESFRGKYNILGFGEDWTWDEFVDDWRKTLKYCPGCIWSTHVASDIWWGREGWMANQTHGRVEK